MNVKNEHIKFLTMALVSIGLACVILSPKDKPVKIRLPHLSSVNEDEIIAGILAVETVPRGRSLILSDSDKKSFLMFLQQCGELLRSSSSKPINISKNADVWKILEANFPDSKHLFLSESNMIDAKYVLEETFKYIPKK